MFNLVPTVSTACLVMLQRIRRKNHGHYLILKWDVNFILFQIGHFGALLHNSYGTLECSDCGNQVGADWMENLRWANTQTVHAL